MRRRVPAPLAILLCAGALSSLIWALLLPPFQGPDEIAHFAYTQRIVENGSISWRAVTDIPEQAPPYSLELRTADSHLGLAALDLNVAMRPFFSDVEVERWERANDALTDEDRKVPNYAASMRNPPLFPLYEAPVYAALRSTDVFTRELALRLATIPWFLAAIAGAWLLAGEVFGRRRRWLQVTVAGTVALHPLIAELGASVNPDAAVIALWSLGFWLAAAIVNRGVSRGRLLGALAIAVAGAFTHGRALPVVVPLLGALLIRAWPVLARRGRGARVALRAGLAAGIAAVLGATFWVALSGDVSVVRVREFGSYLWQFYLPPLGFMAPQAVDWGIGDVWVQRLFSGYGPLDITVAPWILDVVRWLSIAGFVLLAAAFVARRGAVRRRGALIGLLAASVVGLMLILHVAAWRSLDVSGDPVITGRYLTPLVPLIGLAVATVASALPRRLGPAAAMTILALEGLLGLAALGATVVRFHV